MKNRLPEPNYVNNEEGPFKLQTMVLRTPEERFEDLEDWEYTPKYIEDLEGFPHLRMHYIDEGSKDARRTVVFLHGQKTWSYAFRHAIPFFLKNSFRVIAVDLFGFGRSDKLANGLDYNFHFHRDSFLRFIERLDLHNTYIAGFDWGGWIGATVPMSMPDRISGLILGNTALYTSKDDVWPGFHLWKCLLNTQMDPVVGASLSQKDAPMSPRAILAYDAPFPDFRYKAAIRKFPNLIPFTDECPTIAITQQAIKFLQDDWTGACVCIAGLKDRVLGKKAMTQVRSSINGAAPLITIENSGPLVFEHSPSIMPCVIDLIS